MATNTTRFMTMVNGVKTDITALAGGATPSAAANTLEAVNYVTTCATNGDSVILPAGMPQGSVVFVGNQGAARLDVFPNTGASINGGTATTGDFAVATTKSALFVQYGSDGLSWIGMLGA